MKNIIISLLLGVFGSQAVALEYSLTPSVRSYPTSGSVELIIKDEYRIWDQREEAKWKFGFVQPRVLLGAHGAAEAGLFFYPISFLELGAGYGTVSRFYKTKPFDCDTNVCGGILKRHRLTARLAFGHQFSEYNLIAMAAYHRTRISNADASKPLVDEAEVLLGSPGSDAVESGSFLLGAQREGCLLGVYAKRAKMVEARTENEAQYVIYRQKLENFSIAGGVGRYASDFHQPGFSALASATWVWGESISLF